MLVHPFHAVGNLLGSGVARGPVRSGCEGVVGKNARLPTEGTANIMPRLAALLTVLAVLLASCGGYNSEAATQPSTPAATERRPDWCQHNDRLQAEIAFQDRISAEHGSKVTDWPSGVLDSWVQSVDDRAAAAGRLWDAAPASYHQGDVERVCRDQMPPLPSAKELAEECFSGWDGNHDEFERLVAAGLNDPSSIDVHGTYFSDLDALADGEINIKMDYSAANAYGGMVRTTAWARMAVDCNIIEVTVYGYEWAGTQH